MKNTKFVLTILSVLSVSGCANLNSIHRELDTTQAKGVLIDIKQRAILAAKVSKVSEGKKFETIVCAEPSPDSLSAYAAQFAASGGSSSGASGQLSTAFQEGAAFTGLRTQSIQLLRDSLFRICEAYMNGAVTQPQYDLLIRRYQKHTVALLAIEQLTGAIKAPPVTISTGGAAEAARSLAEIRKEISAIDIEIADLGKEKVNTDTTEARKGDITKRIESLEALRAAYLKGIENARGTLVSGSAVANVSAVSLPTPPSDEKIKGVAEIVGEIVKDIININEIGQLCFSHLVSQGDNDWLKGHCKKVFDSGVDWAKHALDVRTAKLNIIQNSKSISDTRKLEYIDGLQKKIGASDLGPGKIPGTIEIQKLGQ